MRCGIGQRLKAAVILAVIAILLLSIFTCTQARRADARASLLGYMTKDPNGWEPGQFNITGTAVNNTIIALGWNQTRLMGNVGLGDGSAYALRSLSNPAVNFSEHLFMAGDISNSPWNPGRIVRPEVEEANNASEEKGIGNQTKFAIGEEKEGQEEPVNNMAESKEENATEEAPAATNIPLDDLYHTILMGRPVDDLLYENPLTITGTAYFRLLGVAMPGGNCINIGMRTVGYGY